MKKNNPIVWTVAICGVCIVLACVGPLQGVIREWYLLWVLRYERDNGERLTCAVDQLRAMRSRRAIPELLQLVGEGYGSLVYQTIIDLKPSMEHVPIIIALLRADSYDVVLDGCSVLSKMGMEAVDAVPEVVKLTQSSESRRRGVALRTLGQIGFRNLSVEEEIMRCLADEDWHVRMDAGRALCAITGADSVFVPKIIDVAVDSYKKEVKATAIAALMEFGPKARNAVGFLIECLPDDELTDGVLYALQAIGRNASMALPALKELRIVSSGNKRMLIEATIEAIEGK